MDNIFKKIFSLKYIILSFFIPLTVFVAIYITFGIYPFKNKILLISDMYSQYISYYLSFYDNLKTLDFSTMLYSWNIGLGNNFIGLFAYYLSSPLNLIILFFPRTNITEAIFVITAIKIALCGLSFSIFIKSQFMKNNLLTTLFGVIYALMSYTIVYSFDIMWLDAVIYLPLIALGINRIVEKNKFGLFSIFLFLTIISNFYISYMVCIFSIIYFVSIHYSNYSVRNIKLFFKKLLILVTGYIFAVGLSAMLTIPTYFALKNTNSFKFINWNWDFKFNFFDLFSKSILTSYDTLTVGLPNIYCGLVVLFLIPLYFFNKAFNLKEKIMNLFIILLFAFSFNIYSLNIFWHAFDEPAWFPYRYSFLFSFVLIVMAYKAIINIKKVSYIFVFLSFVVQVTIIIFIKNFKYEYINDETIKTNLIFIAIYLILIFSYKLLYKRKFKYIPMFILCIVLLNESIISTNYLSNKLHNEFYYSDRSSIDNILNHKNITDQAKELSDGFFRIEKDYFITNNDAMAMGYNGISHYSSFSYNELNYTLERMGLASNYVLAVNYQGSSKITDSLFGIKYIISNYDSKTDYEKVLTIGNHNVYENKNYIPLAFKAHANMKKVNFHNLFMHIQNDILNYSLGENESNYINYIYLISDFTKTLENLTEENRNYKKVDSSKSSYIEFVLDMKENHQLYATYDPKHTTSLSVNNKSIDLSEKYRNTLLDLGKTNGEKVHIKIDLHSDNFTMNDIQFFGLDISAANSALGKLKENSLKNLEVNNNIVTGNINADENEMLMSSIPFDNGWNAYINGKKVNIYNIGEFIGMDLEKGENNIKLVFIPQGIILGLIITVVSCLLFLLIIKIHKKQNF